MTAINGQKTFLELQQEVSRFVLRATIADTNSFPTLASLKQIINDAQREVCSSEDLWFMFDIATIPTVVGQITPYAVADLAQEVRYMSVPANQWKMRFGFFDAWINLYPGRFTNVGNGKPWAYIPAPPASNNALQFYLFPAADAVYSVEYGYKKRISNMTADSDTPIIPPEWQDVLVSKALFKTLQITGDPRWAQFDDSPEAKTPAAKRRSEMWQRNEMFADAVAKFRDMNAELAFTSSTDINRALFVPF